MTEELRCVSIDSLQHRCVLCAGHEGDHLWHSRRDSFEGEPWTPPQTIVRGLVIVPHGGKPRRLGRFVIQADLLQEPIDDGVREAMRRVVVLDARCHPTAGVVQYVALCDAFDLVPLGAEVPLYDCNTSRCGRMIGVDWKRRTA